MSLILCLSIAIRALALLLALWVWRRLNDWRIGFLALMLLLMGVRQLWTLVENTQDWRGFIWDGWEELPGLAVSILALLSVVFLERLLAELHRKSGEEALLHEILQSALDDSPRFLDQVLHRLIHFPGLQLQPNAAVWSYDPVQHSYRLLARQGHERGVVSELSDCPLKPEGAPREICSYSGSSRIREDPAGHLIELCICNGQDSHGWMAVQMKPGQRLIPRNRILMEKVATLIGVVLARQQANQKLRYQARHDALTGLFNRYEFQQHLSSALQELERGHHSVLCYIDLDQFKVINDTCSHSAGDELLGQLAALLQKMIHPEDILARLGGDEFALILRNCDLDQALERLQVLREQLNLWVFVWEGRPFHCSASFGVVALDENMANGDIALSQADAACFMAKEQGRNRIQVYRADDLDLSQQRREMNWVSRLEKALEEGYFRLYAQAIVPLKAHSSVRERHYETLLRLQPPDERLLMPGAFLPAAERYHLMLRIDLWVVERVLSLLARHCDEDVKCSINLSGQSLGDPQLLELIQVGCRQIRPSRLCFEITETAAICNLSRAQPFLEAIRQLGCQIALDDFGSGFSSYAYLKRLPVDYLKIDGQFVRDICQDEVDLAMVRSINELAHVTGKKTVAEWAENDTILEKLREVGVDYAQGYAIGVPLPLEAVFMKRRQAL